MLGCFVSCIGFVGWPGVGVIVVEYMGESGGRLWEKG